MFSYNGAMHFGLLADREAVRDLDLIADYLDESIRELLDAAGASSDANLGPQLV
jgi:hypothetical protein